MTMFQSFPVYPKTREVTLHDAFWSPMLEKISAVTLPDVWEKFIADGTWENFRHVAEKRTDRVYKGNPFHDGLLYEVIRGAADLLTVHPSRELEEKIDEVVSIIGDAQDAIGDGYLETYTQLLFPDCRFGQNRGFLITQHDLYNAGCLMEAGVHYYLATGKKQLLKIAARFVRYIDSEIGYPPKKNIVPAHSVIEQATVRLLNLIEEEPELQEELDLKPVQLKELARFWMDYRGRHEGRVSHPCNMREYAQDHQPLKEQDEAVGHAVRAALLYTGLTATGMALREPWMLETAEKLWKNVTETKMHVNGGIGASADEERFAYQYDLPSHAYLETCAGVAFAFWAAEMSRAQDSARPFDVFERTLYNNILTSLSEDGVHYTYVNPLISDGKSGRWSWHGCPCCPPMFLKMMGALPSYIFSFTEKDLRLNLPIGADAEHEGWKVSYRDGVLRVLKAPSGYEQIRIRIPDYAENFRLTLNGSSADFEEINGYAVLSALKPEDELKIAFDTPIYREIAHPLAMESWWILSGMEKVTAVRKGPFLYCAEAVDNDGEVDFILADDPKLTEKEDGSIEGLREDGKPFRLIPVYQWNNRGNCPMRVWLSTASPAPEMPPEFWEGKLYGALK